MAPNLLPRFLANEFERVTMFNSNSISKFGKGICLSVAIIGLTFPYATQAAEPEQRTRVEVKKELYGKMSAPKPSTRIVDLEQTTRLTVTHGETVTFRSQGQQFTWTFDGLEHQGLRLAVIAPAGFPAAEATVHIGQNPTARGR